MMNSMQSASRKKEEDSSHTIDEDNHNYSYAEKVQADLRESNLDKIIEHSKTKSKVSKLTGKIEEKINQNLNLELQKNLEEEKLLSRSPEEFVDFDLDFLSLKNDFQLTVREPTLEELEKIEEEKLISKIENMNKFFKTKNKKDFISAVTELYTSTSGMILNNASSITTGSTSKNSSLSAVAPKGALISLKNKRSHSFDTIEGVEFNFSYDSSIINTNRIKKETVKDTVKDLRGDPPSMNPNLKEASSSRNLPESSESNASMNSSNSTNFTMSSVSSFASSDNIENIIMQNLTIHDETIKLMVIGDKAVGKTLFIDNLCAAKLTTKEDSSANTSSDFSGNVHGNVHGNVYGKEHIISDFRGNNNNRGNNYLNNKNYNNNLNINNSNINGNENKFPCLEYKPTQSLEIKRFIYSTLNKLIKIELWDTNTQLLSSPIIKTYFKLCHGFILTCDIANLESIKFLEKQIENIINFSTFSNDNLILYANMKDEVNIEECFENLNYLNSIVERFNSNASINLPRNNLVNFVNFREINIKFDLKFQRFINSCLIRKVVKGRNSRMNSNGNASKKNSIQALVVGDDNNSNNNNINNNFNNNLNLTKAKSLSFIEKENNQDGDIFSTRKEDLRDMSASPRTKKEKCVIF